MIPEKIAKEMYKEQAGKILINFMPIRDNSLTYIIKVKEFNERLDELEVAIRKINAPDIANDYKDEVVAWARSEYINWAKTFLKQ